MRVVLCLLMSLVFFAGVSTTDARAVYDDRIATQVDIGSGGGYLHQCTIASAGYTAITESPDGWYVWQCSNVDSYGVVVPWYQWWIRYFVPR